ncbi:hypothetical protein ABPG72_005743 [Tetrahymena utriculariae]
MLRTYYGKQTINLGDEFIRKNKDYSVIQWFLACLMPNFKLYINKLSLFIRHFTRIKQAFYKIKLLLLKLKLQKKQTWCLLQPDLEAFLLQIVSNQVVFQYNSDEFLFALQPTSDGEFLMLPYKKQFSLFNFKNQTQLILLSQAEFPTSVLNMQMNSQETTVFVVGLNGQVVAYDISNKNQIQQIGKFNTQSNLMYQLAISYDEKWFSSLLNLKCIEKHTLLLLLVMISMCMVQIYGVASIFLIFIKFSMLLQINIQYQQNTNVIGLLTIFMLLMIQFYQETTTISLQECALEEYAYLISRIDLNLSYLN